MAKARLSDEFVEYMFQFQMEHLKQANLEVRQSTVDRLAKALFDDGMGDQEWPTKQEITRCVLFGERRIRKNAILCMVKEQLGLIIAMDMHAMARIQCLIRMLPHEKFVPELDILRSPLFANSLHFLFRLKRSRPLPIGKFH